mmetsp:Transcript_2332/g.4855  ORF Transcript_2332/g.4855 Transcript_2332/m.4855 type:complete len:132 (+) Transcript_2332:781-1176(+)
MIQMRNRRVKPPASLHSSSTSNIGNCKIEQGCCRGGWLHCGLLALVFFPTCSASFYSFVRTANINTGPRRLAISNCVVVFCLVLGIIVIDNDVLTEIIFLYCTGSIQYIQVMVVSLGHCRKNNLCNEQCCR